MLDTLAASRRSLATALCIALTLVFTPAAAAVWRPATESARSSDFAFDARELDRVLADADRGTDLAIPGPTGASTTFRIHRTSTLGPELASTRPEIRTYAGRSTHDPGRTIRLTRSPAGLHAWISGRDGWTLRPAGPSRSTTVIATPADPSLFAADGDCDVVASLARRLDGFRSETAQVGSALRVYRLAMTGTGEFTSYHGDVATAEATIVNLINTANGFFERDLAVRVELVAINLYTDPTGDPFPTGMTMNSALLDDNQWALERDVGLETFDIGHVVGELDGSGWSGRAAVASQCDPFSKGRGGTLGSPPRASVLTIGVLHEMGHQLGASHSFNGTAGSCGANRRSSTAYEIGSGVSIMSYAGICGVENVVTSRQAFYDASAIESIRSTVDTRPDCGTTLATGNAAPIAVAGPDRTVPRETAFRLDGAGSSDPDGDPLSFSWEQHDLGTASPPYGPETGPLVRNFAPTSEASRAVPSYDAFRVGLPTPWEILPTVDRSLTFRLVARDEVTAGGGIAWDTMVVTVAGEPFRVDGPQNGETFEAGTPVEVTWTVGGGAIASDVRILMSTDDGQTWAESVANTPNDGAADAPAPCEATTDARIRVEPVDGIFYDIGNACFTVTADATAPTVTCPSPLSVAATGPDGIAADDPVVAAWLASVVAQDACDVAPSVIRLGEDVFAIGVHTIGFVATDDAGNVDVCTAELTVTGVTAAPGRTGRTRLVGVRPNPFNPATSIEFELATRQSVRLEIVDLKGRRVRVLHEGALAAGAHAIEWRATGLASGVYLARLVTAEGAFHRRLTLLK